MPKDKDADQNAHTHDGVEHSHNGGWGRHIHDGVQAEYAHQGKVVKARVRS